MTNNEITAIVEFSVMELCRLEFPLFAHTKVDSDKVKAAIRQGVITASKFHPRT